MGRILLTIRETAESIGCSESTVYRLMKTGVLPVVRLGGITRIRPADLQALADAHLALETSPSREGE